MLTDYDVIDVFDNVDSVNPKRFPLLFKSRVIDLYKKEWWDTVSKSTVMDVYKFFKTSLEYELYLDVLPKSLRLYFTRLRISVHPLRIQTGRYANDSKPRNERYSYSRHSESLGVPSQSTEFVENRLSKLCILAI